MFDIYSPKIPEGYYEVFKGKIKKGDFLLFNRFIAREWVACWIEADGLIGSKIGKIEIKVCRPLPTVKEDGTVNLPKGFSIVASGLPKKGDLYILNNKWIECREDRINYRPPVLIRRRQKKEL